MFQPATFRVVPYLRPKSVKPRVVKGLVASSFFAFFRGFLPFFVAMVISSKLRQPGESHIISVFSLVFLEV